MNKKKLYIFLTHDITVVGGTQMYTAGKAQYLQQRGWQVFVFFAGSRDGKAVIPYLAQFIQTGGGMQFLFFTPPYKCKKYEQGLYLNEMVHRLGKISFDEYEIIIESHNEAQSYWAELLAAKIGARHFFACCDECYRPTPTFQNFTYGENLDFFYFKWKRNEIICDESEDNVLKRLFNGYKNVTAPLSEMPETIREMDAIQDVDFPIEKIDKLDWNICHIGREEKDYIPYVIEGVGKLARRHPDKKIQFIMVGQVNSKLKLLQQNFHGLPNVFLFLLGDRVPIPRILFSKVDVVCAISNTAQFTANENVLTICGDVDDPSKTPGVLGYDTENPLYGGGTFSYVEAFERVLVKRLYDGKKSTLPKLRPADEYYDDFFKIIVPNASSVKEYYTERLSQERIRSQVLIFPFGSVARGARVILVCENYMARDYRNQIDSQRNSLMEVGRGYVKPLKPQPYCQVVATVDEHPEKFDDTVDGLERLKARDYDAIIICTIPHYAQTICDKILQIVPDMENRIVYNFQMLSV